MGRFTLDEQVQASIDQTGLLSLTFERTSREGTVSVTSEDGNRTVAFVTPAGSISGLVIQDSVNGESRTIVFPFGIIELRNSGPELAVFLEGPAPIEA